MPASKLTAQHSPCTLLRRLPSRDNSSKRVKLLRLMGCPLFPSPYPPPRFVVGSFRFWGRIGYCAVERGRVLLFTRGIFFHTVNLVLSSQLSVPTPDSQLPTHNSQLVPEPVEAHQPSKSGGVLYISPNPFETENAPKTVRFSVPTTRVELVTFSFGN